ncbi:pollen-specific leucine-rich repeat extensin-like protein 4 [Magnolia sinica]|uniref:pollen-specific leucine-rich repeat extensin-like protein 4 n=1 Tax=Magnolia sinica TaxID=86752 RepID=UPI002658D508|nr:pollen-specific leucine-rich repeat extensin-like protein 4 [Magnolia sinica]
MRQRPTVKKLKQNKLEANRRIQSIKGPAPRMKCSRSQNSGNMGRMRCTFLSILAFGLLFHNATAAEEQHEMKKLPSAMVVGTVYCDTCFHQEFSKTSHFISGASVAIECGDTGQKPSFQKEVKTNKHGEFKVHLPFAVGKHVRRIKKCSVKLISSSEPYCAVASTATSSSLHLKSRKQGTHIFSAGFFTFKPLKQPELCYEKPSPVTSSISSEKLLTYPNVPSVPPLNQNPPSLNLPPLYQIPQLPTIPNLPPIPNLGQLPTQPGQPTPGFSKPTTSLNEKPDQPTFFYPTPSVPFFQRPPTFGVPLPPTNNPLQPFPPTSNLPPNPFITPPTPTLPFPFPPFPFPPSTPGFPGFTPASPSKKTSP